MLKAIERLLEGNRKWVDRIKSKDGNFFTKSAKGQSPQYFWIGCADSREPETTITGMQPGDIFVHRNISNVIVQDDENMLACLFYAVKVLKIKDIIVCGHYGCGGVKAAMEHKSLGSIDNWLSNIHKVETKYKSELDAIADEHKRAERLVELNVKEQVENLSKTDIVQESWAENDFPTIHGLAYRLDDGKLYDLGIAINKNGYLKTEF